MLHTCVCTCAQSHTYTHTSCTWMHVTAPWDGTHTYRADGLLARAPCLAAAAADLPEGVLGAAGAALPGLPQLRVGVAVDIHLRANVFATTGMCVLYACLYGMYASVRYVCIPYVHTHPPRSRCCPRPAAIYTLACRISMLALHINSSRAHRQISKWGRCPACTWLARVTCRSDQLGRHAAAKRTGAYGLAWGA